MDVKCGGCNQATTIFSHAQSAITCEGCKNILCKPTGGKVKLTEGSAFKVKAWGDTWWSYLISYIEKYLRGWVGRVV